MKKLKLAVYDFDGTLYPGDTIRKFWLFSFGKHLRPWLLLPHSIFHLMIYCLGLISQDTLKEAVLKTITVSSLQKDLKDFWAHKEPFDWVMEQFADDRKKGYKIICISASPTFLLAPLTKKMKWDVLIGSPTVKGNPHKLAGPSARGPQKVVYLDAWAKENKVEYEIMHMFSDRLVDLPLLELAKKKYAVPDNGQFYEGLPKK